MEYDASGYPIGCNPPPVLKIQVNAGKKANEKLSGFYISVSFSVWKIKYKIHLTKKISKYGAFPTKATQTHQILSNSKPLKPKPSLINSRSRKSS